MPRNRPRLRLDAAGTLRCVNFRKRDPSRECETAIARPNGNTLVVRCRNCDTDHHFTVVDGNIVYQAQDGGVPLDRHGSNTLA